MFLCRACKAIPEALLTVQYDSNIPHDNRFHVYEHQSLPALNKSADTGCPLCKILVHNIDLPKEETLDVTGKLTLEHDYRQTNGISLYHRDNFAGLVLYFTMPSGWCDILSLSGDASAKDESLIRKEWLSNCLKSHPACVADNSHFKPTRLLDLSTFRDSSDLVLVETGSLSMEDLLYVTLSHCWGTITARTVTTTCSNLLERCRIIPYEEMPLTFRDAIDITRQFNIRYLWIDSLCIVQDSLEDLENEASTMGDVYANSFCTLAASGSSDSQGGCRLKEQESTLAQDAQYVDIPIGPKRIRFFKTHFPTDWQAEYLAGPLRKRAWALQERELSQRVLHYAQSVLLWECKTSRFCGDLPWIDLGAPEISTGGKDPNQREELDNQILKVKRERWFSIIQDYSERSLTFETDKLSALSGLAHKNICLHGFYYAGIREKDLPHALLWRTRSLLWSEMKPYRPTTYRAPSWSLASIEGCVTYEATVDLLDTSNIPSHRPVPPHFTITKIIVETTSNDRMGQVASGYMKVHGCLKKAVLQTYSHWRDNQFYRGGWRKIFNEDGEPVGCIALDVFPQANFETIVFCLAIATTKKSFSDGIPRALYSNRWEITDTDETNSDLEEIATREDVAVEREEDKIEVIGLALTRADTQSDNTYTRVGLVRWMRHSWFKGVIPTEITIF